MRATTLLGEIFGLKQTRILEATFDDLGLVIDVAPSTRVPYCSSCERRVRVVHDRYEGRRWRHLDLAALRVWLRYTIRRVDCPRCGVVVELVPWAENQSWFTYEFEEPRWPPQKRPVAAASKAASRADARDGDGVADGWVSWQGF